MKEKYLSDEEKIRIMIDYREETGEKIHFKTRYNEYPIGNWQNNLRTKYYKGELNLSNDIMFKAAVYGILPAERERREKTTIQDKYEFLMYASEMSEEKRKNAKMDSGLEYKDVVNWVRVLYNRDELKLSLEQIENLKKRGILSLSKKETEEITKEAEKYGIPLKYAKDIKGKYDSFDKFIYDFKRKRIDYDFKGEFCGCRGILISEESITERQKLNYANLINRIVKNKYFTVLDAEEDYSEKEIEFINSTYIDIDELNEKINLLSTIQKDIIRNRFGLDGNKPKTLTEIGKKYRISKQRIAQAEKKAITSLGKSKSYIKNILKDKNFLKRYNKSKEEIKILLDYIDSRDGKISKRDLDVFGISDFDIFYELMETLKDHSKEMPVSELDLSRRARNCLAREGIVNIKGLLEYSENDLRNINNFGIVCLNEIKRELSKLGLKLRDEKGKNDNINVTSEIEDYLNKNGKENFKQHYLQFIKVYNENLKDELKEVRARAERYRMAKEHYLNNEELFNPEHVIPGIRKKDKYKEADEEVEEEINEENKKIDIEIKKSKLLENINLARKQLNMLEEMYKSLNNEKEI